MCARSNGDCQVMRKPFEISVTDTLRGGPGLGPAGEKHNIRYGENEMRLRFPDYIKLFSDWTLDFLTFNTFIPCLTYIFIAEI